MYNSITNAENLKEKSALNTGDEERPITSEDLDKWNKLIAFSKEKGYSGNRDLDHDPILRKKIFDEYNKSNPKDAVPMEMVLQFQREMQKYKAKTIEEIKANAARGVNQLAPGSTLENFMKDISQEDNVFGSKTSSWQFPSAYINNKRVGFANKVNMQELLKK